MKNLFLAMVALAILISSCNQSKEAPKVKAVMSAENQKNMSPDAALKDLMEGNERYVSGNMINRDLTEQIKATTNGQYPKAVVLACIDSRVPVEYIFDQGVGDIFVARVAGNIEDVDLLGSMEYGVGVAGSKIILVMGHENCGAVKSAIKKVDVGSENVTALLNEIEPAILEVEGERDYKNKDYFDCVVKNNVLQTIEDIRKRSKIIRELEVKGQIKVVGAYYSLKDGKVSLLEDERKCCDHS